MNLIVCETLRFICGSHSICVSICFYLFYIYIYLFIWNYTTILPHSIGIVDLNYVFFLMVCGSEVRFVLY